MWGALVVGQVAQWEQEAPLRAVGASGVPEHKGVLRHLRGAARAVSMTASTMQEHFKL